jgi:molybdopterin biosynthesis enzyme
VPDDDGLAHQLGMLEQLDRREERVHVDVQQVRGEVVDRRGGDLPPAAVLLAHAAILSPAAVSDADR